MTRAASSARASSIDGRPVLREPVLLELTDHVGEELRRDRQVEGVVARRAAFAVKLLDRVPELAERHVVGEVARHEPEALGQLPPDLFAERRP